MSTKLKYKLGEHPDLPAPNTSKGAVHWLKVNLFSNWYNTILTILAGYFLVRYLPSAFDWLFFSADFFTKSRAECTSGGACWGVITSRWPQYMYGFYPSELYWRPNLAFVLLIVALVPLLYSVPHRKKMIAFSLVYPLIAFWLLWGGFGLEPVESAKMGGLMLTVMLGVMGIGLSLPVGILLALGRRSEMPVIKTFCVIFIEFIRGVPMISLLFMATVLLPLFLPSDIIIDQLIRVIFIVVIFSSAYIAEVVRGGLQAIPKGQYEAGAVMGLSYWQSMNLIILPQALKISIPGIVNSFIGLFKDTTLVIIVGMFDLLGVGRAALSNKQWIGLANEVYMFIALMFFIFCYSMAIYSLKLEKRLSTSHK
ncbi:MAG: amino acid ABC transporter permease [Alphaproteobacteria bacterium]